MTVESEHGQFQLTVPRDGNSEFEPVVVPKGSKDIFEIEQKVLNLYGLGMSTSDITNHIEEILRVADERKRYFTHDHSYFWKKKTLVEKTVYALIGINMEGFKEVVGIYLAE